jgi:hypothetical protein
LGYTLSIRTCGAIGPLRVNAIQLAHAQRQIAFGSFHDDVIMIRHLAPRVATPIEAGAKLTQHFQPGQPIAVIEKNFLATIAARRRMINIPKVQESICFERIRLRYIWLLRLPRKFEPL